MGVTYQNHGAPVEQHVRAGIELPDLEEQQRSYFGVGPNALSSSFLGLKETRRCGWSVGRIPIFRPAFNPQSGKLSDGLGSIVQNNGLAIGQQNSFADSSSKDGQAFTVAAYAGLSSPIYGTLTYGRQNALTSDGVANYDPMSNSGGFLP